MLVFPAITMTAVGNSIAIVRPYSSTGVLAGELNALPISNFGLTVTVSATAALTYSVQVTGDVLPNANGNWNSHDVLRNQTTSMNSNVAYGISGLRLSVSSYTSGSVTLGVVQWP